MSRKYGILFAVLAAKMISAQTQINLHSQARDVDFSAAPSTKPAQTGAVLPLTCSTGAFFVLMSNPPGQNVYICTSANIWTLQAGGSGGGSAPNVLAVSASGATLSIGSGCNASAPCNVRVGSTIFSFINGMTGTVSSGASGTAYVYVSSSGTMTIGDSMTVACSGGSGRMKPSSQPRSTIDRSINLIETGG